MGNAFKIRGPRPLCIQDLTHPTISQNFDDTSGKILISVSSQIASQTLVYPTTIVLFSGILADRFLRYEQEMGLIMDSIVANAFICWESTRKGLYQSCHAKGLNVCYCMLPLNENRIWPRISFKRELMLFDSPKGSLHQPMVQFFLTLFKRPLAPPPPRFEHVGCKLF